MTYVIENIIATIKTYLEANLATKLEAINLEYDDDLTLTDIKPERWRIAELTSAPSYPVGILLGDRIDTTDEGGFIKTFYNISVACLLTDTNAERLRRRLYRYIRAFSEVLYSGQKEMGLNLFLDGADYSSLYSKPGGFLADARVLIRILKYED